MSSALCFFSVDDAGGGGLKIFLLMFLFCVEYSG
jgi:hypothetical protein